MYEDGDMRKDWGNKVRRYGIEKLKRWLGKGKVRWHEED
jgi:hypothetical protein